MIIINKVFFAIVSAAVFFGILLPVLKIHLHVKRLEIFFDKNRICSATTSRYTSKLKLKAVFYSIVIIFYVCLLFAPIMVATKTLCVDFSRNLAAILIIMLSFEMVS